MIDIRNRKTFVLIGLVILLIFFFSTTTLTVTTSYDNESDNESNNVDEFRDTKQDTKQESKTASDKLSKDYSMYGLPEQDEYMSQTLRDQLRNLETKFYYDNCRYTPL